ncbi:MAG: uroporphyrinogen decarboxylase family protein [Defluviitaleaceae bacterium]|nr:uroporphyrinogen decarboxylase family protein [Defluviitaleaceae bacterium]
MEKFSFDDFNETKNIQAEEIIDILTEQVVNAYPPEKLERIKKQSGWSWNSALDTVESSGRISYVALHGGVPEEPRIPEGASEIQADIISQLKMMLHNAVTDDEYYPGFSSGCEQITVPSMFCAKKESISGSDHIKPLIESPSDVYSLPEAKIRDGFMCSEMLRRMAYKHIRMNKKISVYITDIQGPFSCAAQLWGIEKFLGDLYEYPNEAHHLLSLCTDAIIDYYRAMYDAVGSNLIPIHCFPMIWVPKDCGVAVSDDFFAVVGRHTAEEFSIPYLEKIGRAFGGLTVHTCGNMNHLPHAINNSKHIRAINFGGSETDLMKYASECDRRITVLVHQSGMSVNGLPVYDNLCDLLRHRAHVQKTTGVKIFSSPNYTGDPPTEENRKKWEEAASLI